MKAKSLFFAALAVMMAACVPTEDPKDEFVPEFKVSGVKGNTISVGASGKDVTVSVTSNLSWNIDCQSDWVSVKPDSYTAKEDKTSETIKVKVSVLENEVEEAREATLTIAAEGVDPVTVTVKQDAKEVVLPTITVVDDKLSPIENFSVQASCYGETILVNVQANGDWKAEFPEWISLTPADFTYDANENIDLAQLTLTIAYNDGEQAREGEILFKGEFERDLVVKVKQEFPTSRVVASLQSVSYRSAFFDVVAPEGVYWYPVYGSDEAYAENGLMGFADFMIGNVQGLVDQLADTYTPEQVFALSAPGCGSVNGFELDELDANTKYNVVFVPMECKDGKTVSLAAFPGVVSCTTAEKPVASADYQAVLGTFENNALDYFKSSYDENGALIDEVHHKIVLKVEEYDVNESVIISFVDGNYFPVYKGAGDPFVAKYEDGKIVIENYSISEDGFVWGSAAPYAAVFFTAGYWDDNNVDVDNFVLSLTDGNLVASATPESVVEGDSLYLGGLIWKEGAESPAGYQGIAILDDNTFVKVQEEAASSASSMDFSMKAMVKEIKPLYGGMYKFSK